MKKVLSLILGVCMIFSSVASFSAVDSSYKEVLEIIKNRIPDTDDYDDFNVQQNVNNGIKTYYFSWYNAESGKSMGVECLENGIITRLSNYSADNRNESKAFSEVSKEEALEKAINAFNKLNPEIKDKVRIEHGNKNKQLWETRQYFVVTRIENGIEVYGDSGNIEMDINAENIIWFYINWTNYEDFENPENSISVDEAKKIFSEKLGLCLTYKAKYESGKIVPYLFYTLKENGNKYVDFSGNIITCNPYAVYRAGGGSDSLNNKAMLESMDSAVEFSAAEIAEMEKLEPLFSQQEIEDILRNNKNVNISDVELSSASVRRDYYDKEKYYYNFNFTSDNARVTASVDASTGEIISYYRYADVKGESIISEEDALKKAEQAVKELCVNNFDEYQLITSDGYSVQYCRMVNDIRFPHDSISVTVDEYTGEISSYSKTYSNVEFPSKENVISLNMVYKCAYEMFPYNLKYVTSYNEETKKSEVKLVFAFTPESFDIDPFTGEKYNYGNEERILEYEDIENHYAKKYIEELAEYGIGIGNKIFKPDEEITQKDYISLLVKVFYRYFATYSNSEEEIKDNYKIAVQEGIIPEDEIDYNAHVTRSEASKYLVNALGYKDIAKAESIFLCPFDDVTQNKGSITILYGLKIVNGDEKGNFNPQHNLTRADTMILLYKTLSK